jgi:hypothetical protein
MKAMLIIHRKKVDEEGNITEMSIWKLPKTSIDRSHGIKYRCYFGDSFGRCIVRYDNESGKGDHKHVGKTEEPYMFDSVEKLMRDFITDIRRLTRKEK